MTRLRDVIWGSPDDTPYLVMGDWYWIYLQGAWYSAMSRCVVGPLLDGGTLVLADTWTHKYLAKLALRPVDFDRARAVFDGLVVPDLVIRFELDPKVAAARKHSFGISESGNHEGKIDLTGPGFIEYQSKLADILTRFGIERHWTTLDVNNLTVAETVQQLMEIISDRFPALVPPP
jgi:thymidylate kinase